MYLLACVLQVGLLTCPVLAVSQNVLSKALHDHLFTDYDSNLIPICAAGENVTVNMDIALRQIVDLSEREQVLTSNIWIRTRWNDCRLQWDPSAYSNITYIMVGFHDVWVPDLTLYDSSAEEVMFPGREDYRVSIYSTGTVSYNFPTVTKSICRVQVKLFPFDTQKCPLQFGSWSHHGFEMDLVNRNPSGDLANYIENTEWSVTNIPVERHVLYYNCCPEPYPDVTFYLVMERRPAFYLLTMLFPCILTSCVAALAFLLPVESGEKVSLEITVLLSLAVFLLLVSESLPPSSEDFPIIGSYFASSMVLVSLSLLQTVIVLNVFYRGTNGRRVPRWLKVICFNYLGRALCIGSNKVEGNDPLETIETYTKCNNHMEHTKNTDSSNDKQFPAVEDVDNELENGHIPNDPTFKLPKFLNKDKNDSVTEAIRRQTAHIASIDSHYRLSENAEILNSEWRYISNVLDRLFLVLYMLVLVITTLAFLLQCV